VTWVTGVLAEPEHPGYAGIADYCWHHFEVEDRKISAREYEDVRDILTVYRSDGKVYRRWWSLEAGAWDVCELAEQIDKERGGSGEVEDPVAVIYWMVEERKAELTNAKAQRTFDNGMLSEAEADQAVRFLALADEKREAVLMKAERPAASGGNGGKYRRTKREVSPAVLEEIAHMEYGDRRVAVYLMLEAGLRISEALDARWRDLDVEPGYLWVRRRKGGENELVPITVVLQVEIDLHRRVSGSAPDDMIAGGIRDQALRKWLNRQWDISPHQLRHTFACRLRHERGCDVREIQALLGHRSISSTTRYDTPRLGHLAAKMKGDNK